MTAGELASRTWDSAPGRYLAPSFSVRAGLRYLGGFFAIGVGVSTLYATTGVGFWCPLRTLTGWQCPLCGGTRLGSSLLHLQIGQAFAYNPLVFVGLVVLTVLGLLWVVEALGGPRVRPPAVVGLRLRRVHPTTWLVLGLAVAAAYTVLRNLL